MRIIGEAACEGVVTALSWYLEGRISEREAGLTWECQ